MSFKALAWAVDQHPKNAADKLILLALSDRHNDEDRLAWPSVDWLCLFSSLNRKTVIAALGRLEDAELIADSGERKGRTKQVKCYRLALDFEQSQKRNGSVFSSKQSQKRDTEPVKEPTVVKASALPTSGFVAPPGVSPEIWSDFLATRKKQGHPVATQTAYNRLCSSLGKLIESGHDANEIVGLAVEKGWRGFFAPREGQDDGAGTRNELQTPMARAAVARQAGRRADADPGNSFGTGGLPSCGRSNPGRTARADPAF